MGLFDNIVLGLLDLVEGKNKAQDMAYDEALSILIKTHSNAYANRRQTMLGQNFMIV